MTKEEKVKILKSTEKLWNERNRLKELEKENAELKENHESDKQAIKLMINKGVNIEKENEELKRDKTELINSVTELKTKIAELEKQNEKLKCCGNCIHYHKNETIRVGNNVLCRNGKNQTFKEPCLEWELANE